MEANPYKIILFYKYVRIDDPAQLRAEQFELASSLGFKGRLLIAAEGVNGTFEGTKENTEKYIEIMKADPRFADVHWKISNGTGDAFPKLKVKVRNEIVATHLDPEDDVDPNEITGVHLKPEELHEKFEKKEDLVIIDMRNDYEYKIGHFENSAFSGMENFRDLKNVVDEFEDLKDKEILTVCTGGVRCEKASGYLLKKGFKKVYQLDGGIVSYMEKYPGEHYKGTLYVFDSRMHMNFTDPSKHEMLGRCDRCEQPYEKLTNCSNLGCHKHILVCDDCVERDGAPFCNDECKQKSLSTVC